MVSKTELVIIFRYISIFCLTRSLGTIAGRPLSLAFQLTRALGLHIIPEFGLVLNSVSFSRGRYIGYEKSVILIYIIYPLLIVGGCIVFQIKGILLYSFEGLFISFSFHCRRSFLSVYSVSLIFLCYFHFTRLMMADSHQHKEGPCDEEHEEVEVDEVAKAVYTLRRSGLFKVEPTEDYGDRVQRARFMTPGRGVFRGQGLTPREPVTPGHGRLSFQPRYMDAQVLPQPPRVSTFSGCPTKSDVTFDVWLFEVRCLLRDGLYPMDLITQSVRRSLRGEAGRLAMHLGEEATAEEIIRKLQRVYGVVESGAAVLQRFYNSRQEENEGVAAYGCRLEDTLSCAVERGGVSKRQADEMLRNKLWTGLRDERVKNVVRHRVDQLDDFDSLLAEVRAAEQEVREGDKLWGKAKRAVHLPLQERVEAPSTASVDSRCKPL